MSFGNNSTNKTVRFGCIGIRGYGRVVCDLLAQHHVNHEAGIRFVAACDPVPDECTDAIGTYRGLGVEIVPSADALIAMDLDAVWLPLPIHLHREYTAAALESGKAVICEKPAAGCVSEVEAMIETRDKAGLPVLVGFQHMFDPAVLEAKDYLVTGQLGEIRRAVVYGCWPRTRQYYSRNNWAGRKRIGQRIINDSPASNAMSHFIMLALFLLGSKSGQAARVERVQPYLYRAADIETYDTVSMRITTADGQEIDIHLSHASKSVVTPTVTIQAEKGELRMADEQDIVIDKGGRLTELQRHDEPRRRIAPTLVRVMRGELEDYPAASLENAREHVRACELADASASVIDVSPSILSPGVTHLDGVGTAINDIEVMISECVRNGQLLSTLTRQA